MNSAERRAGELLVTNPAKTDPGAWAKCQVRRSVYRKTNSGGRRR